MRILAAGGAGFVGSAVVRTLLLRGHEVWVYDNLSTGHPESLPADCLIRGDLSDTKKLTECFKANRIEAVMHFAASIAVGESVEKPRLYYRNNVANSLSLLDALQDSGVQKILFSSTAAVYAPVSKGLLNENSTIDPKSPYAFSKYAIERMIHDFSCAYGLGYTLLRYFNACGGSEHGKFGEDHQPETHLIPLVLQVPLGKREYIAVFGKDYDTPDGTCIRDYIHIDDLADAHVRAVEALQPGDQRTYNIGTGHGNSVLEVIRAAEKVGGQPIPLKIHPRRAGDTTILVAGSEKLQRELGWKPRYTDLESIIESAWQWHKQHPAGYQTPCSGGKPNPERAGV